MTLRHSKHRLAKNFEASTGMRSGLSALVVSHPYLAGAAALAALGLMNRLLAAAAERHNPPSGKFVEADGVRLHYVEQGHGQPLHSATRQRQHAPGLRIERTDPCSVQETPGDRLRPSGIRPQQAPAKHDLDGGRASEVDRISAGQAWDLQGDRAWTFVGLLCVGGSRPPTS